MSHTVAVIGAHGKVARLALPQLVGQGWTVIGVVRNPDHTGDIEDAGATPVVFDIQSHSTAEIADMLTGNNVDTVVWSAGAGGGDPERTWAVDRDAAIRSMDAAVSAGVRHYVMVSYFGAGPDHGVPEDHDFYPYAQAKSDADARLAASGLTYTLLRPSRLTHDEPTGRIDADAAEASHVSRGNVARALVAAVENVPDGSRLVEFNDGDTPVESVFAR